MKNGVLWLLAAMVSLVSGVGVQALQGQPPAASAQAPAGDAGNGRQLFMDYSCYYCHGTEGQGGLAAVGPRVARVSRSLPSFTDYLRRPTGRMSAYSERVLPDASVRDIYAYLRGLPAVTPAADLPLLDALRKPGGR